jgi:hypothetical protein
MRSRRRVFLGVGIVLVAWFATLGCGGSSSSGAKIRLINGTPDISGFDLLVDGTSVASNIAYSTGSAYASVKTGARHFQVEPSGTTSVLIDRTDTVNSGTNLSLMTLNFSGNISSVLLTDDNSAPTSGNFKLRVINGSPGLQTQDVYVEPAGTNISSVSATFSGLAFGSASAYVTLAPGNYQVSFTQPGQKFINLQGSLQPSAGQVRTLLALNLLGGGFETSVLADLN